jgi:two-component system chemotaxis sensor kinase CheA
LIGTLKEIGTGTLTTGEIVKSKKIEVIPALGLQPVTRLESESISEVAVSARTKSAETVRISLLKLDPLLQQAEEFIGAKKSIRQRITELQEINTSIAGSKLEGVLSEFTHSMERDQYYLDILVDNHLESMRQVLLLPVSSMIAVFPGMVRKISHEQNKEIDFIIRGEELEIDKRILEELKDPLIHLIRNSIDHGIDKPDERILQNKPPHGTITLAFTARESGMIEVMLSDDGKGINSDKVLKAAIKSGNLSAKEAEKLDLKEILALIYKSGVSTSSIITDMSGRGLGLSIVLEKAEKLNGRISVESEAGKGTTFRIFLPMTLATFRGILVRITDLLYILPTLNVERVMKVKPEQIKTIGNHETVRIDEEIISVVDLGEVLGLPDNMHAGSDNFEPEPGKSDQIQIVILVSAEQRIAFKVDEVIDEQQVLVKGLGKLLVRVKNISGATILGSGKVVPVLHISDLIKSALNVRAKKQVDKSGEKRHEKIKKILVADDSITSRTLIKNILETAGYQVLTAVDGTDAYTKARSNEFDLIISDVDMPRMNGFEFIKKVRNDVKLKEVPVIIVTSLGSQEDHERGIEVGADAYIIKSNFDQTNLLEIIKKLI